MAPQDSDHSDSLGSFWDDLRKEAARRDLKKAQWYEQAKRLSREAKKKFISDSAFYKWVSNERGGKYDWPWDGDLQFVVQAAVGTDEEDWGPWRDRWETLRRPGDGRKGTSESETGESSSRGKWLATAAVIVGLIAAIVSIVANILPDSNKSAGDTGGAHTVASSPDPRTHPDLKCRGLRCEGKNPEQYGCGIGAGVVHNEMLVDGSFKGVVIQIKYSDTCQALWAKITGGTVGDIVEIYNDDGDVQRDRVLEYDNKFTPMLPATSEMRVHACVTRKSMSPKCTPDVTVDAK